MPNRDTHVTAGVITGLFLFIILTNKIHLTPIHLSFGIFFSVIGSVTPDTLEPATNWNHRAGFHSWFTLFTLLILGLMLMIFLLIVPENLLLLGFGLINFIGGYLSHLLLGH